jgi:hypothetical protein
MRGENFVVRLDGLGGTPVCRGTPVAHHWFRQSFILPIVVAALSRAWVHIPLKAWMFVLVFLYCFVLCR